MPALDSTPSASAAQAIAPSAPADKQGAAKPGLFESLIGNIGAGADAAAKRIAALDASTMKLTPPELKLPPKPEAKNTDPVEAWGSTAMVFAALASFAVRGHATAAMNAAAAAMKGIQAKDKEITDQNFKEWEAQTKNAIDMANFQQNAYKTLLDTVQHKEDMAFKIGDAADRATEAKIRAVSAALQDPAMTAALDHGGIEEAAKLQTQREKTAQDFKERQLAVSKQMLQYNKDQAAFVVMQSDEFKQAQKDGDTVKMMELLAPTDPAKFTPMVEKARNDKVKEVEAAQKEEDSAAGQAKRRYDDWLQTPEGQVATQQQKFEKEKEIYNGMSTRLGGKLSQPASEESRHFLAQQIASYQDKVPALGSYAFRSNPDLWASIIKEAHDINPDFNEAKYDIVKAARLKITTGKDADAVASYVRLNQHLQFFSDLVDKLSSGSDIKALDKIAAAWGRQTGNPNVTSYDTALQLVGDEMVKAATGTGAAGALGDREEIKKNFDPGLSKDQLKANIDSVRTLVGGAIVSTLNKYRSVLSPQELQTVTGLSPEDLKSYHVDPQILTPTVKGMVTFGGKSAKIGDQGVESPSAAPSAAPIAAAPTAAAPASPTAEKKTPSGVPMKQDKSGQWWAVTGPGKGYKVDENGNPVQ
ncbi:MAG: hypothetical protein KGL39_05340 [Patescibacteria group bacterium]|nr:hypothetical protein [Patescibacteria group bacterium]